MRGESSALVLLSARACDDSLELVRCSCRCEGVGTLYQVPASPTCDVMTPIMMLAGEDACSGLWHRELSFATSILEDALRPRSPTSRLRQTCQIWPPEFGAGIAHSVKSLLRSGIARLMTKRTGAYYVGNCCSTFS